MRDDGVGWASCCEGTFSISSITFQVKPMGDCTQDEHHDHETFCLVNVISSSKAIFDTDLVVLIHPAGKRSPSLLVSYLSHPSFPVFFYNPSL